MFRGVDDGRGNILLDAKQVTQRFPRRHHIHVAQVKADNCGGLFGLALDGTKNNSPQSLPQSVRLLGVEGCGG